MIILLPDRSPQEAALALAATWLAYGLALSLALPPPPDPAQLALGDLLPPSCWREEEPR